MVRNFEDFCWWSDQFSWISSSETISQLAVIFADLNYQFIQGYFGKTPAPSPSLPIITGYERYEELEGEGNKERKAKIILRGKKKNTEMKSNEFLVCLIRDLLERLRAWLHEPGWSG